MKKIDMARHIRESNLIEGIDDAKFDEQAELAWEYLTMQKELTGTAIRRVQKVITLLQHDLQPDQRGYWRDLSKTNVRVGDQSLPAYNLVPRLMENWLLDFGQRSPIENHIAFERIHPFVDGNGRTGRMLMWWQEIQNSMVPTLILNSEKADYYQWFGNRL